jgi:hypothetical protein
MMNYLPELQLAQQKPTIGAGETDPLAFLKAVYMNADLPLSVRMRAAIEVLPFTHPKLAVTAQITENDFATLLDRRIAPYHQMKMIGHQRPATAAAAEVKPPMPMRRRI